jgi:hypothetical protein
VIANAKYSTGRPALAGLLNASREVRLKADAPYIWNTPKKWNRAIN